MADEVVEEVLEEVAAVRVVPVVGAAATDRRAEAHLVGPQHPHHQHQREAAEGHEHRVHDPLLRYQAAVEERQALARSSAPTKVAAVSCQEVLPVSSHDGWHAAGRRWTYRCSPQR